MPYDADTLLWHARQAAGAITDMTAGKTFEDFDTDIMLRSAVERQFQIAGEALRELARLDPDRAADVPDLPRIVAFRNILVHAYAVIDRARVWSVVETELPSLIDTLDGLLGED